MGNKLVITGHGCSPYLPGEDKASLFRNRSCPICLARHGPDIESILLPRLYHLLPWHYLFTSSLAEDVYEQASIQYHSIRDLAAYTTPRAGLSLWHMLYPLKETNMETVYETRWLEHQVDQKARAWCKAAYTCPWCVDSMSCPKQSSFSYFWIALKSVHICD